MLDEMARFMRKCSFRLLPSSILLLSTVIDESVVDEHMCRMFLECLCNRLEYSAYFVDAFASFSALLFLAEIVLAFYRVKIGHDCFLHPFL